MGEKEDPAHATKMAALVEIEEAKCPGHPNILSSSPARLARTEKVARAKAEVDQAKCPGHPNILSSSPACLARTEKVATPAQATPDKAAQATPDKAAQASDGPMLSNKRPPQLFGTQGGNVGDDCFSACEKLAGNCFDEKQGRGFCGQAGIWSGSCCKVGAVGALLLPGGGVAVLQSPDCRDRGCTDKHCCVKDDPGAVSEEDIEEKAENP